MPADWTAYETQGTKLLDISIPYLPAGANQVQSPVTGTVASGGITEMQFTAGSIQSSTVSNGYLWDAYLLTIISPIAADGSFPDFTLTVVNGTKNLQDTLQIDGSYRTNIFPHGRRTRGLRRILLGAPFRKSVLEGKADPTRVTGLKVTDSLSFYASSTAGWNSPLVPARVIFRGDVLTTGEAKALQAKWRGGPINLQSPPVASFSAAYTPNTGAEITDWWASLPGGAVGGNGVKVDRKIITAYNNVAVAAGTRFLYTNKNTFGGQVGNVANPQVDLGDDYAKGGRAFEWLEIGFNLYTPGASGYLAWYVDNVVVPQETTNGLYVSYGDNPFAYGADGSSGEYVGLTKPEFLASILSHRNAVVPIFQPLGSAVPVNQMSFVKSGIQVVRG